MNRKLGKGRMFLAVSVAGAAVSVIAAAQLARADSITVGTLAFPVDRITGIQGDEISYESAGGDNRKSVTPQTAISIDSDPALGPAEQLFVSKKYSDAVDGYQKAMDGANQPWLKAYIAKRMLTSAQQAQRFDVAIGAWIQLVHSDPAGADKLKPSLPPAGSSYLATEASKLKSAAEGAASDREKLQLLNYLLSVQTAAQDEAGASATAKQLQSLTGGAASPRGGSQAVQEQADTSLSLASLDLEKKNYKKALDRVQQNRQLYNDPKQQATALWIIAEANAALLSGSASPSDIEDAALNYMRFDANFPDDPHAMDALLKTAALETRAGNAAEAKLLYRQVEVQTHDSKAAAAAKDELQKLQDQ